MSKFYDSSYKPLVKICCRGFFFCVIWTSWEPYRTDLERFSKKIHGAPYFYPAGDPGPPTLPSRGPWGPPQLCFLPEKNFRQLCRRKFFSASQSSSGGPWGPLLLPSRGPRAPYFSQKGPMGPPTIYFPTKKQFRRACAPEFFWVSRFFIFYINLYIL